MSFHEREKGVGGQNLTSSHQKLKSKLMRIKYSQVSHRIIQPGVLLHMGRKIIMRCFFFLKSLSSLLQYCSCFYVMVFWPKDM